MGKAFSAKQSWYSCTAKHKSSIFKRAVIPLRWRNFPDAGGFHLLAGKCHGTGIVPVGHKLLIPLHPPVEARQPEPPHSSLAQDPILQVTRPFHFTHAAKSFEIFFPLGALTF
jgi:hypothetical protein